MTKVHRRAQGHKTGAISNRQLTRLLRKRGSYRCHGCRRRFKNLERTCVGYDAAGRALSVGECCTGRLREVCGMSVYFALDTPTMVRRRPQVV
jgi:hypothetical protein